jgi:hypothetical protein
MAGAILSTGRQDYNTPLWIVTAVREFFHGKIDLDPCSNETSLVGAVDNIRYPERNGLFESWARKSVYCNPPFGYDKAQKNVNVGTWVAKAQTEAFRNGAEVIMCIPASPETNWWQEIIFQKANGICWLDKRVVFLIPTNGTAVEADAGITKAIALVYFGREDLRFYNEFQKHGVTNSPRLAHQVMQELIAQPPLSLARALP